MKKKMSLILIILITFTFNMNLVGAANPFKSGTINACGFEYLPSKLPNFSSNLYDFIKLIVPIVLIVMGMVDLFRAMMANEISKMKDIQKKFVTRLIAAVVIFLVMALVEFVFKQVDKSADYKNGFVNCMNCILSGDMAACGANTTDLRQQCSDYDYRNCKSEDDYGHKCMVDSSDPSNLKCRRKGTYCEDYTASECPSKTDSGVYNCEVSDGKCRKVLKCESYSISQCNFESKGACTWNDKEKICVKK